MEIYEAEFVKGSALVSQLPPDDKAEFALAGRSNVGKSSLLNFICGRRKLARTSNTPGRTQMINHFLVNGMWYIADLPGYGYAKVSQSHRAEWLKLVRSYLSTRKNLAAVLLLVDVRVPIMKSDLEFIHLIGISEIPLCIVFTKADGLKKGELDRKIAEYRKVLSETWDESPEMIITSAAKGIGKTEVLEYIGRGIENYSADQRNSVR